jgi:arsenical pump membrane protein
MGLIAAATNHAAQAFDLGPNPSVIGSLATILWLIALRREGVNIPSLQFLRVGLIVMTPALLLSLLALSAISP